MKFLFQKGHSVSKKIREKISKANSGAKNGMYRKHSWNI